MGCNPVEFKEIKQVVKEIKQRVNERGKEKFQTKLKISSLWHSIMQNLSVQDHINAACACTEWFVYASNDASWTPNLSLSIKTQWIYEKIKIRENMFKARNAKMYQTPEFAMGMFSHYTQRVELFHFHQWGYTNLIVQMVFDQVSDKCTQLKYIYMDSGTLQLNRTSFKQLCNLKNLRKFEWSNSDDIAYDDLKQDLSPLASLRHLQEMPARLMSFALLPHNIPYVQHLPLTHVFIDCGVRGNNVPGINKLNPSNLIHLKGAYDTLINLDIRWVCLKDFEFKPISLFRNITSLCIAFAADLSHEFIRSICTSGLKLTTLIIADFSVRTHPYIPSSEHDQQNPFDQLGRLTSLTRLELSDCSYVNDFRIANQLLHLKKLRSISLNNTSIDIETFKALGYLHELERIQALIPRINVSGLDSIAKLPKLIRLDIFCKQFDQTTRDKFHGIRTKNNLPKVDWN